MLVEAVVGFCVGVLARYIVPDSPGVGGDTLAGIVGGGLGGFIYKLFNHQMPVDNWNAWSITSAAAGALILILIIRATAGRRTIA
jgi:uncharacterized membrane protein YeaQ/YmgE (transglycosylase-associated protein family)